MVMLAKNSRLRFQLQGQEVDAPVEWEDIKFQANFENGSVQPNIDIDSFTFVNEEAEILRNWIDSGKIFEGVPFKIDAYNIDTSKLAFNGYVNCSDGVEEFEDRSVSAKVQLAKGLNTLNDQLEGLTMTYLYDKGVITNNDFTPVDYVVEAQDNTMEILFSLLTMYILLTQLKQQVKSTSTSVANAVGHITGGITGTAAGAIFAVAVALIEIAYTVFMVLAIISLGFKIFEMLLPIVREHKTLKYRIALSKISNYLGYNFISPIAELDTYHYLPSNNQADEVSFLTGLISFPHGTAKGIPNEGDYGYTALEFFDLCKKMFQAKIKIVGNDLHFRAENDPFFTQSPTYQMPNFLRPVKKYNTEDFLFSKFIKFELDEIADEWTLINFKGTNYEVITDDPNITNTEAKYLTKHETVNFPVALGNRKDELNGIENVLSDFAGVIDDVVNFFGGSSDLASLIDGRIGMLKVGTNNTTKAKVLVLNGANKIPLNNRDLLSAKLLYNKYINHKSFVLNNYGGQKAIYPIDNLPFGFNDFLNTIENSNFTDDNGDLSKFRYVNWVIAGDVASVEFETHEIYAPNLVESYIEQS